MLHEVQECRGRYTRIDLTVAWCDVLDRKNEVHNLGALRSEPILENSERPRAQRKWYLNQCSWDKGVSECFLDTKK